MARHNRLGTWGEQLAREFMLRQGYAIAGENVCVGNYEIDFIAYKDDRIIFVEVKTRSTDFVDPTEAVTPAKMKRLSRAADSYIRSHNILHEPQIDVITVIGTPSMAPGEVVITHYPDAFMPPIGGI